MSDYDEQVRRDIKDLTHEVQSLHDALMALHKRVEKLEGTKQPVPEVPPRVEVAKPKFKEPSSQEPPVSIKPTRDIDGLMLENNLEFEIGSNWLNRIGIFAIVVGMGFFLKYAFDNQWIGEAGRIIIGILVGLGLIGAGEYYQRKLLNRFAQGFSGGGIGILYLAIYSAYIFYRLIPFEVAFAMFFLITLTAVLLSLRYNAPAITVLGFAGGYLAPFLLHTPSVGPTDPTSLFLYTTVLNIGIVALASFKRWGGLVLMGFFFSYLTEAIWSSINLDNSFFWHNIVYLTGVFTVFSFAAIASSVRSKAQTPAYTNALILINGALYMLAGLGLINLYNADYLGLFTILLALLHFGLGYALYALNPSDRVNASLFVGLALLLVTVTIPIQLDYTWFALAWSVEGLILIWIGLNNRLEYLRIGGLAVLGAAIFSAAWMASQPWTASTYLDDILTRALTFIPVIASCFGAAYIYLVICKGVLKWQDEGALLALIANIILLIYLSRELYQFVGMQAVRANLLDINMIQLLSITIFWSIYSVVLILIGIAYKARHLRIMAITLFLVTILKLYAIDLSELDTIYRIVAFILLGVALVAVSLVYQRHRDVLLGLVSSDMERA